MNRKLILLTMIAVLTASMVMVSSGCKRMDRFVPVVETYDPDSIMYFTAFFSGMVLDDHGYPVESRGFCWSPKGVPTMNDDFAADEGKGLGRFGLMARTLPSNTRLYVRAWATNKAGTGYGSTMIIETRPNTCIDGKVYRAVKIGEQIWMAENLAVSRYNDYGAFSPGSAPFYENDSANLLNYGRLYTRDHIEDGRLCPVGWRMPTVADWDELNGFLGGHQIAGGKLKERDTIHWQYKNVGATDEVGFGARGGGRRLSLNIYIELREAGYYWALDTVPDESPLVQQFLYNSVVNLRRPMHEVGGGVFSVRCILDI